MNQFKKGTCLMLTCCLLSLSLPVHQTQAAMIGTETVLSQQESPALRNRVNEFFNRSEVANELQKLGVDPPSAKLRVDAMTDNELQQIAGKIDQMPAGGDSILGVVFAVFIILLITDILGLTRVFPFTRSIR
ncbi:MAG: PA2779 family protein [Burkholderiales bacterium]